MDELSEYLQEEWKRSCQATAYSIAQGTGTGSNGTCYWWLRTPGSDEVGYNAACVFSKLNFVGFAVDTKTFGIRPVIWIILDKSGE